MLTWSELRAGAQIEGLEPGQAVRIVSFEPLGDGAGTVYYKLPDGSLRERLLFAEDLALLSLAAAGRPWSFAADGASFILATEALRIHLAHLFDPLLAVHCANIDPLPHQITAVYEAMLPRQPLRFLLADDPGAGKTIMAGLLMRELMLRGDAERILVVAPGSLVEQWQDELLEKFDLAFDLFSRELAEQSPSGNPFQERDRLIARLDMLARDEGWHEKLEAVRWDLVVFDEAHKLSASYSGHEVQKTARFRLGELLGGRTRHLLLMTATPHNGKEEEFQLFLSLLDADRFYGRFRDGVHRVDVGDLMRRMVKERLVKFDGTPLFPERRAYTVAYRLSDAEAALYAAVTDYVSRGFDRAERLSDRKRGANVGFALASLQRRLASSPEAIYQSLRRRREQLTTRLQEARLALRGRQHLAEVLSEADDPWEERDEQDADTAESREERLVASSTAAETIHELEEEIATLERLERMACELVRSRADRKWEELSRLLQDTPEMRDADGRLRKLIIFTEHRDTLNYLRERIGALLGRPEAVVEIHGGTRREARRAVQERFRHDPEVRVLVATDAAGEGINLQNANLMVNYDLPWNPNRIEQRFGRIHRIGQTEVCHLWNLVAAETREGAVFQRLLEKLDVQRQALGGQVFDILGELFEERPLRDLLIEAIRYGDRPEVRERLSRVVDDAFDREHLQRLLARHALAAEAMDERRLFAVRAELEKAEARKLQPHFVRAYFGAAFAALGGQLREREPGRFEITHVPREVRERDRQLAGRDRRYLQPVAERYERVCFDKALTRLPARPQSPPAEYLHPAHPLLQAVTDLVLERHRGALRQGAVLLDPHDPGTEPRLLVLLDHAVREGADPERYASRRLHFVALDAEGRARDAGWAPHLDLQPLSAADRDRCADLLAAPWVREGLEQRALAYACERLAPEHYREVAERRRQQAERIHAAVRERLVKEINHWADRVQKLQDDLRAGLESHLPLEQARRIHDELVERLKCRERALAAFQRVESATPVVLGAALVIPQGLLAQRRGEAAPADDAAARARIERLAMQAVMAAERALGHEVFDVSAERCGWDITSIPRAADGRQLASRHFEVKGRAKGQRTITVTRNEALCALNQGERYFLAIVLVDGERVEGPYYVRQPFTKEPDWAVTGIELDLDKLLARAVPPQHSL